MGTALKTVDAILDELDCHPPRNIAQRINAVMGEVDYVQKDPKKPGMQYSYASHDKVTAMVRPILHKHGVVYYPRDLHVSQNGNRTEAVFSVRFENIDYRSDYIDVATFGYGVDSQDKGPGKAMSYGVKYALLKALGLETGDEAEAEQGPAADHKPDVGTDEPKKRSIGKLDGTYTSITALETAARAFTRTLNGMGDLGDFIAWGKTPEIQDFLRQCKRDLPDWFYGGPSVPNEFVPLEIQIANKKRDLEQIEELSVRKG